LQSFRNQFGTTPEFNTITQYSGSNGTIALTNLAAGAPDWFDNSTPPTNVTDAITQGEVSAYLSAHAFDANAIYEVVLPAASYASFSPTFTSCGGPVLRFCAYHDFFTSGANAVKYSIQPYPSCAGCQAAGWSPEQNQEHFVTHETREAITDPLINGWLDSNGEEADDKCAWSPAPFFGTGGYGYQYEWSNAANDCVASTPYSLPPDYTGTLEHAGCDTLSGWAADRNRLNTSITVSIYDSGTLISAFLANGSRPDIGSLLGDNGLHGFTTPTPSSLRDGAAHLVSVRFEGSSTDLVSSPVSLTCSPPPVAKLSFSCTALACSFNGAGSTGSGLTYAWTFGDSGTGTGSTPSHTYGATGIYTVTLTVTDSLSRQSSVSKKVSVTSDAVAPAESYFAVAPCRILDTRNTTILTNNVSRIINIAGNCGIPAKAVSLNATVVSPTGSGKITLYPGNLAVSGSATLNFAPATSPRANSNIVQLATDGTGTLGINAVVTGSPGQTHLVLDVQGYFSTDTTSPTGVTGPLGYQTLPICRLADTRTSTPLTAGIARTFTAQGVCGVPAGAAVAEIQAGVIAPATGGFLTLYSSSTSAPPVSAISFNAGISALRNSARVNLASTTPDFAALFGSTTGATVNAAFDVNGYFMASAPLRYHPIVPCRAVDTTDPALGGPALVTDVVRTFQIQGNCGVPVGAKAAVVRLKVSVPTSVGVMSVYPSDVSLPPNSTIQFDANEPELSMGAIVALSTLADDLAVSPNKMTAGGTVNLLIDVLGYFQ
jgi:PKD repeat protein